MDFRLIVATVLTVYGIETKRILQDLVPQTLVATVLTVYGIETSLLSLTILLLFASCNSTYRLRYATKGARQQRSKATMRSAHL